MQNLPSSSILPGPAAPGPAVPALRLDAVVKDYAAGEVRVRAVDGVSLVVGAGTLVAVTGRSGSGKSTLLNLIAGIDVPTSGSIQVAGIELSALDDDALTRLRRDRIGIIYQFFNLLSTLDVRENVALPAILAGVPEAEAMARADRLLDEVAMTPRARARPHALSGGELQRASIARALAHRPALVLADEPTGNLDTRSSSQVLALLRDLGPRHGATVMLVTHSPEAATIAERVIELRDGRIASDAPPPPR